MSGPARIRPTVCTNRPESVTGPCLSALRNSGLAAETVVVLSGVSGAELTERRRGIDRLIPQATVLVEDRGGASRARNRALTEAQPTDVLAFLDDDAVISETWVAAMARRWSDAAADVAAIGGPVKPLFLAPRPAWLTDQLLRGLSIVDYGPDPQVLEIADGGLFTANLAMVAQHALAVGGFDLRRGPQGSGPGFGEDIVIQDRLREHGLKVLYEPAAAVFHRIGPNRLTRTALLHRRYAQGIEMGRSPYRRQVANAVRGVIIGATRAGGYTIAGRPDIAIRHLAYSAQSVGVLSERARRR